MSATPSTAHPSDCCTTCLSDPACTGFVVHFNQCWLKAGLLTLGFWIVAAKPIQFYYHYLLPSMFLLAALALALDALWQSGRRWLALGPLAISAALFAWFYPILSAAPLDGKMAFLEYTWLKSWQ